MKALVAYALLSCVLMTAGAQARGAGVNAAVVTAAVPLKEGMTALQARQALSKNKWIPNPSKHSREVEMWGLQKKLYRRGYQAIDQCAIDRSVCLLKYKKEQICLAVEIEGERVNDMRVIGWSHDCQVDS